MLYSHCIIVYYYGIWYNYDYVLFVVNSVTGTYGYISGS